MILADEIAEMMRLLPRSTPAPWIVGHDRMKQPIVVDSQGRVIVEADTYAEDIRLIVMMRRVAPLLVEDCAMVRHAAEERCNVMELTSAAQAKRDATTIQDLRHALHKTEIKLGEVTRQVDAATQDGERMRAMERELERLRALETSVANWRRTHYSPALAAAYDKHKAGA